MNILKTTIVLFIISGVFGCKRIHSNDSISQGHNTSNTYHSISEFNTEYKEVDGLVFSSYTSNASPKRLVVDYKNLQFNFAFIDDRAYLSIKLNNDIWVGWNHIDINFFYGKTIDNARTDIHLLLENQIMSNGYLLFPSFTEEYPSYFLYYFSKGALEYLGNYSCRSFEKGSFLFNETQNELYLNESSGLLALHKIEDNVTDNQNYIEDDLKLIKLTEASNSYTRQKPNENTISYYTNQPNYFIKSLDVNKDGIQDKIVSQKRYQGDELLVFLGNQNSSYDLALETINFSEDGGCQVSDVKETNEGFKIVTTFPGKKNPKYEYSVRYEDSSFLLYYYYSQFYSWQDGYTESCFKNLRINLKNPASTIYNSISTTPSQCTKKFD